MKKKYLFLLILMMFFPALVSAADVNVSFDCPSTAKNGDTITCTIKASTDINIKGFQADISASSGLDYEEYATSSGWGGDSGPSTFLVYKSTATKGTLTLGTYTYKVSDSATGNQTVTLDPVEASDENGDTLSVSGKITETIKILSSDATLSNITVSSGSLSPSFSKDVTSYTVTVDGNTTSINIGATATNSGATVTGTGNKTLNYGENPFKITVKSEAGTTKTYTLNVIRPDNRSTDNSLSNLSLSAGALSPSFNKDVTSYTAKVKGSVTNVIVSATLNDTKAQFIGEYKPRTVNLKYGENLVEIKVKSEKGTEKTYKVVITREDSRSGDNTLSALTLSKGELSPKFSKNTTSYTVKVEKDVESIDINATLTDKKSSFVNGFGPRTIKLETGTNKVLIKVKSEKETERTYTINVIRDDGRSYDNDLKTLSINDKTITIEKDKTEYSLSVDYTDTMFDVKALANDTKSTVKLTLPKKLVVGENIVKILVTAENKSTKEYVVKVNMLAKNEELVISTNLKNITVSGYELNFSEDVKNYYLKIADETTLDIIVEKYDDTTNYEIIGNSDLKNGSVIQIKVTTPDNQESIYSIEITKEEKTKSGFNYYWIVAGLGVVLVILIILIIIDKTKKGDKTPKVKTTKSSDDILKKVESQLNNIPQNNRVVMNNPVNNNVTDIEEPTNYVANNNVHNVEPPVVNEPKPIQQPVINNEQNVNPTPINNNVNPTNVNLSNNNVVQPRSANEIRQQTIVRNQEQMSDEINNGPTKICAICGHRVSASATVCPYCKRTW